MKAIIISNSKSIVPVPQKKEIALKNHQLMKYEGEILFATSTGCKMKKISLSDVIINVCLVFGGLHVFASILSAF